MPVLASTVAISISSSDMSKCAHSFLVVMCMIHDSEEGGGFGCSVFGTLVVPEVWTSLFESNNCSFAFGHEHKNVAKCNITVN